MEQNPTTVALIATILGYATKYGIPAARSIITLVHTPNPTEADWLQAFDESEKNARIFLEETKGL